MKSAGKARSNGLYRHIRTSKEIIRNLLNYYGKQSDGFGKLHRTFTFPILMGEPCHTGVSLSRYTGYG